MSTILGFGEWRFVASNHHLSTYVFDPIVIYLRALYPFLYCLLWFDACGTVFEQYREYTMHANSYH